MVKCVVFALLLAFSSSVTAKSGTAITSRNFEELVKSSRAPWVVEFYSGMCGSCQEFEGTWDTVARNLAGKAQIGRVSIDDREGMALAQQLGVLDEGIPNVKLFVGGRTVGIMASDLLPAKKILKKLEKALPSQATEL